MDKATCAHRKPKNAKKPIFRCCFALVVSHLHCVPAEKALRCSSRRRLRIRVKRKGATTSAHFSVFLFYPVGSDHRCVHAGYVAVVYSDIADGSVRGVLWTVRSADRCTPTHAARRRLFVVPLAPWPCLIPTTTSESVLSSTFTGNDSVAPYFTNRRDFRRSVHCFTSLLSIASHGTSSVLALSQEFRKFKYKSQWEAQQEEFREFAALGRRKSVILVKLCDFW